MLLRPWSASGLCCSLVALLFFVSGCGASPALGRSEARPEPPVVVPPKPMAESYNTLSPSVHYYAVVGITPFEDHFTATFHHVEGAYCNLTANAVKGVTLAGCGFPAGVAKEDDVPDDKRHLLAALKASVLRKEPAASSVHVRFDGSYAVVMLEEEVPCEIPGPGGKTWKHGHGYHRVELRYTANYSKLIAKTYSAGSRCGAARFYWASPAPKWLPLTSRNSLLESIEAGPLDPLLMVDVAHILEYPERDWSVPMKFSE